MSIHRCSYSATRSLPPHMDLEQLRLAQACITTLLGHGIPTADECHAWSSFQRAYEPVLRAFVVDFRVGRDDQEDCLQEVWTVILKKLPSFTSDGTQGGLCSWLHAIVHAKAVDLVRFQSRHPTKRLRPEAESALVSPDADPAAEYERQLRREAVHRVLELMRPECSTLTYRAFYMHWIEGRPLKNIAAELNMTKRKLSCRIYKAKEKFRRLCDEFLYKNSLLDY
jgi:RNA polymerase sigma factor (sigma-70 family)